MIEWDERKTVDLDIPSMKREMEGWTIVEIKPRMDQEPGMIMVLMKGLDTKSIRIGVR